MFSSANNRESSQTTYRLFGKLTQKFGSQEESENESSSATIKNAFFTIQGDYTNNRYTFVDADHQFDLVASTLDTAAADADHFALKVYHGVTDAPAVDIYANGT